MFLAHLLTFMLLHTCLNYFLPWDTHVMDVDYRLAILWQGKKYVS